jgi:hypothetical protein
MLPPGRAAKPYLSSPFPFLQSLPKKSQSSSQPLVAFKYLPAMDAALPEV